MDKELTSDFYELFASLAYHKKSRARGPAKMVGALRRGKISTIFSEMRNLRAKKRVIVSGGSAERGWSEGEFHHAFDAVGHSVLTVKIGPAAVEIADADAEVGDNVIGESY